MNSLAEALATARDRAKEASLDGENNYHRYKYATHHERIRIGKHALKGTGLSVIPTGQRIDPPGPLDVGARPAAGIMVCSFALLWGAERVDLGERQLPIIPEKGRPVDKAALAAQSEMLGYLYRDLLAIPTNDGLDVSGRGDDETPASVPARSQATPAGPGPDAIVTGFRDATTLPVYLRWVNHGRAWLSANTAAPEREGIVSAERDARRRIALTLEPSQELADAIMSGERGRTDAAFKAAGITDRATQQVYLAWGEEMSEEVPRDWTLKVRTAITRESLAACREAMEQWGPARKRKALPLLEAAEQRVKK